MQPFRDGDTFGVFQNIINSVVGEINSLDNNYVLKASESELQDYFINKAIIKPLLLYPENKYIKKQSGTKIDTRSYFSDEKIVVQGTKIEIAIPFDGDPILWRFRASTYRLGGYPDIDIQGSEVVFSVAFRDDAATTDSLLSEIEQNINSLISAVSYLKSDVINHNNSAPSIIKQTLAKKFSLAKSTTGAIASLGIPIKRASEQPTFAIPAKRRNRPSTLPLVIPGSYEPEPILEDKEYLYILEILKSMALVIERNPSSFSLLNEEAIRDHFLLQLNGHYEGGATGETFNASGKTDILIREGDRNVFIAECKFWHGQKAFSEAIKQLLSYLTWRDSKCALLIFNKTKDSDTVRQKMHQVMELLPEYRKTEFHKTNGDSRYVLVKSTEPGKEIIVTTQIYDIPNP